MESVFDYVSNDVLCHIFQFLPSDSISACARTCARWNEMTVEKMLWKNLYRRDWYDVKGKAPSSSSLSSSTSSTSSLASSASQSSLSSSSSSLSLSPPCTPSLTPSPSTSPAKQVGLGVSRPKFKRRTNFWRLLYQQKVVEKMVQGNIKTLESEIWNKLGFWATIKVDRNISAAITSTLRVAKLRELMQCLDMLDPQIIAELKRVKPNIYFILSQQSGFQNLHLYLSVNQTHKEWLHLLTSLRFPDMCAWLERLRNIDTRDTEDVLRATVKVDGDQGTIQPFIDKILDQRERFVALLDNKKYPSKSFEITLAGKDYSYVVNPPFCHRPPIELIQSIFVYCHECTVDMFYEFMEKEAEFIYLKKCERQALELETQAAVSELVGKLKVKDIKNQSPANIKPKKYLRTLNMLLSMVDELLTINLEGIVINIGYEFYIRDGVDLYIPCGCPKEKLKEYLMEAPIAESMGDSMVTDIL